MPEGPSIVILREQVEALDIIGQKVETVSGNSKIEQGLLARQPLTAVKSWGKQFFLCFPHCSLRVHFLLWGSYRINERKEAPVRLRLDFANGELNFYSCSLKIIEGPLDSLYDWSEDVMAPEWDAEKAFRKLKTHPELLACDALLDQHIFSGVGNIIKNEVLFRIRVNPLSRLGDLSDYKLKRMVKEARVYSFEFLQWKKAFELRKHYLVYNQKTCPRCHGPVRRMPTGKNNRRSFFCPHCQPI
jgi:endonuclease-8